MIYEQIEIYEIIPNLQKDKIKIIYGYSFPYISLSFIIQNLLHKLSNLIYSNFLNYNKKTFENIQKLIINYKMKYVVPTNQDLYKIYGIFF